MLRLVKGYRETMLDRNEVLVPWTHYGDSGAATMGELSDKVKDLLQHRMIYGATLDQVRAALNPARQDDVDRAVLGLEQQGAIVAVLCGDAKLYFEHDHGTRAETTRRVQRSA